MFLKMKQVRTIFLLDKVCCGKDGTKSKGKAGFTLQLSPAGKNLEFRWCVSTEFQRTMSQLSMMNQNFKLFKNDPFTRARRGVLTTPHGTIQTPFFMPVGTNGTVKTLSSEDLHEMNSQIVLSNTYHLFIRPGTDVIKNAGGLHKFMNWDKPILTDSGGYQVFSLAQLRKLTDQGVEFQSHFDGKTHFLTPEDVISIQRILGSDIMMPLDECAPFPCERDHALEALERTTRWAKRSKEFYFSDSDWPLAGTLAPPQRGGATLDARTRSPRLAAGNHARSSSRRPAQGQSESPSDQYRQFLFGIIQGAAFKDLRERSAREIIDIGFDGYAVGGVSVGEPVDLMFETLEWVEPLLPEDHPRYFMGIGYPDQIVRAVGMGMDMFDTVIPTRFGRNGSAFTDRGRLAMRNAEYTSDTRPLDENCACIVCRKYSRSYIRHLLNAGEILGLKLLAYHNVTFYIHLMERMRGTIEAGTFKQFHDNFLANFKPNSEGPI